MRWVSRACVLATAVGLALCTGSNAANTNSRRLWDNVTTQHDDDKNKQEGVQLPRRRYSHTATLIGDRMVVTHGYMYDHTGGGGPTWMDDTWAFNLRPTEGPPSGQWVEISSSAKAARRPHGRMSHAAVSYDGQLVLFGGDDGGHLKNGNDASYEGTHLNDLWTLNLQTGRWSEVEQQGDLPPPRAHHSAVQLRNTMIVFGGLHRGDVWSYNFDANRWSELFAESDAAGNPGKRHGHSTAVDAGGTGFYIFGGFLFAADMSKREGMTETPAWGPLQDLWHFDVSTSTWSLLEASHPAGGRTYSSMALAGGTSLMHRLVLFAGAHCKGSCNCFADTWTYNLQEKEWVKIEITEPITRYKQSMVLFDETDIVTFGGESYKPYMYHNSVMRLPIGHKDESASPWWQSTVLWAFVVLLVAALVYRCSGAAKLDADAAKRH